MDGEKAKAMLEKKKSLANPSENVAVSKGRIWIDGCFDFSHHGHAGAILQARRLGTELFVGIHSDEEILDNKGPTVMNLTERIAAVDACRWTTKSIPYAPYVTDLRFISRYGCHYVVHGDDITSDSGGEDCYRFVKAAGRFLVVKRTPGISTTDLVGRMLLYSRSHFIKSLQQVLVGEEGPGNAEERRKRGEEMTQRIKDYATDASGLQPGPSVMSWDASKSAKESNDREEAGHYFTMVEGKPPRPNQRIVYVDGGFDLFSSGHIEFLRQVVKVEEALGRTKGWYEETDVNARVAKFGEDYGPAFVVAGVHDDEVINYWKGVNYPIMNIFERGLCVLQCKYISSVIFGAPFTPSGSYLKALPFGLPSAVYHGPTSFMPLTHDPYAAAKSFGIYQEIGKHDFQHVNAEDIVQRIVRRREMYEERQRAKAAKAVGEASIRV